MLISQDKLRPTTFDGLIGQEDAKTRLKIAIAAAKARNEPVPHVLLGGSSPGIGKTTLAYIVAHTYGAKVVYVNSPGIKKVGELNNILINLEPCSVLILDECHALPKTIAENLLPVMEDGKLTIKLLNEEVMSVQMVPFTLIGCTTEVGKLIAPLRDRFEIQFNLQPYSDDEISRIVAQSVHNLGLVVNVSVIDNIAKRARGVPRIANRFVRRVRDYAQIHNNNVITDAIVNEAMRLEKIDELGLSEIDKKYLFALQTVYGGGPCGLKTLASTIGEDETTVKDFIEPFLIRRSLIAITKQGRILTRDGISFVLDIIRNGGIV